MIKITNSKGQEVSVTNSIHEFIKYYSREFPSLKVPEMRLGLILMLYEAKKKEKNK